MIKIDKNIPVPPARLSHRYPWLEMEIGDSFFTANLSHGNMGTQAARAGKRHNREFVTRKVDGGIRVWRVT